jgi:DNA-directed RNA polymerase subunit RPC12/RpoP
MEKCYVCGNALEVIKDKPYEYTECGLPVLLLGITQYRCGSCGEEYAAIPAPEKLHKLIGLEICRSRKALLLPEEIKFLRKEVRFEAIRQRIRKQAGEKSKNRVAPTPPRYDEVFFNGVMEIFSGELAMQNIVAGTNRK